MASIDRFHYETLDAMVSLPPAAASPRAVDGGGTAIIRLPRATSASSMERIELMEHARTSSRESGHAGPLRPLRPMRTPVLLAPPTSAAATRPMSAVQLIGGRTFPSLRPDTPTGPTSPPATRPTSPYKLPASIGAQYFPAYLPGGQMPRGIGSSASAPRLGQGKGRRKKRGAVDAEESLEASLERMGEAVRRQHGPAKARGSWGCVHEYVSRAVHALARAWARRSPWHAPACPRPCTWPCTSERRLRCAMSMPRRVPPATLHTLPCAA